MKITVAIPAYNCSATIEETLDAALAQTTPAHEILVLDDGSSDATASILRSYGSRITLFQQENQGAASARNFLAIRAQGDLIAFLDSDDVWHPRYLEIQGGLFEAYPGAAAYYAGHVDFDGYGKYAWESDIGADLYQSPDLIKPLDFFSKYNETPGCFQSMSFCCVPKTALASLGEKPFGLVSGAEDVYFAHMLALVGSMIVYFPKPLGTEGSLSANRLKLFSCISKAMEHLGNVYEEQADPELLRKFKVASASKNRQYAKLLMRAGNAAAARQQLRHSLAQCRYPFSFFKSLTLLTYTYLPTSLQPSWPSLSRQ
jgi:glycosyltransferase involved in cell wall biosynthesis